jgi:hypothetical protein
MVVTVVRGCLAEHCRLVLAILSSELFFAVAADASISRSSDKIAKISSDRGLMPTRVLGAQSAPRSS